MIAGKDWIKKHKRIMKRIEKARLEHEKVRK